ncbi:NADH:flavin oxidoreductase/NADH oxidase [bacterium]|nr:NADH:flavin oxidoreductase/NADH oxidase [bacterium]
MSHLFTPLSLRSVTLPNRITVSPMCMYSAVDGIPQDWHLVHLGARASGGAGLIIAEATAVVPEGRISPGDTGLWNDEQVAAWARINTFIESQGSVPGVQLGHAGRKASTKRPPFDGVGPIAPDEPEGWQTVAPSAIPFKPDYPIPHEMTTAEMHTLTDAWVASAKRAHAAGFKVIELHMAHGYLLHQFYSPITNQRTDEYGGSRDSRMRYPLEVTRAVRAAWPEELPLLVRISARDWVDGGWTIEDSIELAKELKAAGVDLIDCSSGGGSPEERGKVDIGDHPMFAERVRRDAGITTGTVGGITEPAQAEAHLAEGRADLVLLARQLLREPTWPQRAAQELGDELVWPKQYGRAKLG